MSKKRSKVMALACALVLVAGLVGCGKQNPASSSSEGGAKEGTIRLWHIFGGDADPNKEVIDRITKEAEEKFNVTIQVDTAENESYKTKIKAAVAANETPDIFYTWGHGFLKPFVDAKKLLPLDEFLTKEYQSHLSETTLTGFQFEGSTYGLTTDQSVACLFFNKELFERHGLRIPTTYDEFVTVCRSFMDKGVTPLSVGAKEAWTIAMYHDLLALRNVGSQGVKDATGKITGFEDEGFLKAATQFAELASMGAFPEGSAGISREESEVPFLQGQVPMYLNGSWTATRVYKDASTIQDKVVVAPFPTINKEKSTDKDFTGGPDTAFSVSKETKNPELAAKVAQYLALEFACAKYEIGSSILPYVNVEVDESKVNPLMKDIYHMTKDADSYTIWWDNLLEGKDATVYLNKLQELFIGQITPEQFVGELQSLR